MCGDPLLRHCGERRDRFGWVSRQISGVGAQCPPHQWTTIPLPLHMFNSHPGWLLTVTCCYLSIFLSPHEKNIFQSKSTQSPSPTHQVSKKNPLTKFYKQVDYFFYLGRVDFSINGFVGLLIVDVNMKHQYEPFRNSPGASDDVNQWKLSSGQVSFVSKVFWTIDFPWSVHN